MKKHIHIGINLMWICIFFLLVTLTSKGYLTVSERLYAIDLIATIVIFVIFHLIYILIKVKDQKILNAVVCVATLCIYLFFPVHFNPF